METIEDKLKGLILYRYKSIRQFCMEIDIPNSTVETIFKRGIVNASISNIIKICSALNISADMLAQGEIKSSASVKPALEVDENNFIIRLRLMNKEGRQKVYGYAEDLAASGKYENS